MNKSANDCINCSVNQCKHHSEDGIHCALSVISVGTHEANPTETKCTDCMSFELKY